MSAPLATTIGSRRRMGLSVLVGSLRAGARAGNGAAAPGAVPLVLVAWVLQLTLCQQSPRGRRLLNRGRIPIQEILPVRWVAAPVATRRLGDRDRGAARVALAARRGWQEHKRE